MERLNTLFERLDPRTRAVLIWLGLIPIVLLGWSVSGSRSVTTYPLDAIPTFLAARVWAGGHPEAIYHPTIWLVQGSIHPQWLAEAAKHGLPLPDTSFVYSPVYLALVLPLAISLSLQQFLAAVTLGSAGAALVLGYESTRFLPPMSSWARWIVALGVSLCFPASYTAQLGQNGLIAACLVLVGFRWAAAGMRRRWAGIGLLILACAFKHWCVLFLGVFLLAREYKSFAVATTAYGVLLWGIPKLVLPQSLWEGNLVMLERLPKVSLVAFNDVSLRALIRRLEWPFWPQASRVWNSSTPVDPSAHALELGVAALVGLVFAWLVIRKRPSLHELAACAMAVVLLPLGICWSHYLVFALPLVVLVAGSPRAPRWLRALAWFDAFWMAELMAHWAPLPADLHPSWAWAWVLSAPLLLSVILALAWLSTLPDAQRRDETAPRASAT